MPPIQEPTGGFYFKFIQRYKAVMVSAEAEFVLYFLRFMKNKKSEWVPCHTPTLEAELFITKDQQSWTLKKLKEKGYVSTEIRGDPGKRWITVHKDKIEHDIQIKLSELRISRGVDNYDYGMNYPHGSREPCGGHTALIGTTTTNTNTNGLPLASRGEDGVLFTSLATQVQETPPKYNNEDVRRADKLKQHVRKIGYMNKPSKKIEKWEMPFRYLRLNLPEEELNLLDKVLDWFCSFNTKKEIELAGLPDGAQNAKMFKSSWDWILRKYKQDVKMTELQIPISVQAEKLARRMRMVRWPKGSGDQLEAAIQISYTRYTEFRNRVRDIAKRPNAQPGRSDHLARFAEYFLGAFYSPDSFIEHWFGQVQKRINNWEDFNGRLDPFIFNTLHKDFLIMGMNYAQDYAGKAAGTKLWNDLIQEAK